jgi:hypothetical protein
MSGRSGTDRFAPLDARKDVGSPFASATRVPLAGSMKGKIVLPSLVALVLGAAKLVACSFGPPEYTGPFPQAEAVSDATTGDDSVGDGSMSGDGTTTDGAGDDRSTMDGPSGDSGITDALNGEGSSTTDSGGITDAGDAGKD